MWQPWTHRQDLPARKSLPWRHHGHPPPGQPQPMGLSLGQTYPTWDSWMGIAAEPPIGLAKAFSGLRHHRGSPVQSSSGLSCITAIIISLAPHLSICFQEDPTDTLGDLKSHCDIPILCSSQTKTCHWSCSHSQDKGCCPDTHEPRGDRVHGTVCQGLASFSGRPNHLSGPRGAQQFPTAV